MVLPLAVGGVGQGLKMQSAGVGFSDVTKSTLPLLRVSTMGLLFLLLGSLLFAANIFAMTIKWKLALLKSLIIAIKKPLETAEVKS